MLEEKPSEDVEKVLSGLKSTEDCKQSLSAGLLWQKAVAVNWSAAAGFGLSRR
jgi:hypothetical protein